MSANPQEKAAAKPGGMEFQGLMLTVGLCFAISGNEKAGLVLADDPVKGKYLVVLALQLEAQIITILYRCISTIGQQSLIRAGDIFAKLGCAVHFITLRKIRADFEHLAKTYAGAALGRVL